LYKNLDTTSNPTMKLCSKACWVSVIGVALGGDPSTTWEAYAEYAPAKAGNISLVAATYTVPADPITEDGSTPKWWVGLQSTDGSGVLMKPQLTWRNDSTWSISTEVLDYSLSPAVKVVSKEITVVAGDVIDASVTATDHTGASGEYTLRIGKQGSTGATSQTYTVVTASEPQTRAYAVMEHQPTNCSALPAAGALTLHDVRVGIAGAPGHASVWVAKQHLPACGARSAVAGRAITFSWELERERERAADA
jgi:hypothetical protein